MKGIRGNNAEKGSLRHKQKDEGGVKEVTKDNHRPNHRSSPGSSSVCTCITVCFNISLRDTDIFLCDRLAGDVD